MSIEAMKQALDNICGAKLCEINSMSSRQEMLRLMDNAITTLRQAIAEAEKQKPVAWMVDVDLANYQGQSEYRTILAWNAKPVWSGTHEINEVLKAVPLYTHPPKREPLTDEQIDGVIQKWARLETIPEARLTLCREFARAVEAAHGIKGEAA